ncbi:uncharacterized protein RHIMIDRAFT_295572 [Rhizopus microsporus ATCC 52813]|uniref:Transmembrane protein 198 n=1 Tax=Rhizopus microsporus ATCC 52813 TaxID=1340429 RepID=A0A2G4SGF2_RHIZD|nr:uncharacterized protein RHIMIDRAFT_295572 [Rhizopus microsporus ATCC 52813]PHZ07839.1 hypothetical protein RHIMIDRAFT_295572 [Rhizopus microsporus ATCC 52813]
MKLLLILQLICTITVAYSFILQPLPTKTATVPTNGKHLDSPTPAPQKRLVKRDVSDTLSLYEMWADDCNNNNKNNAKVAISGLNALWQTVTSTVYCGNGRVTTITKTVTATSTATATKGTGGSGSSGGSKGNTCDDQCWSTYLWHTYGYGISVAQGITGTILMILGICFLIFGFSSFRGTLAATGFVFFACMTWIGLVNNEPQYGYPNNDAVYLSVSCGLGLIGAFLFMYIYSIAVYFIGCVGGFFLAVFILSWKDSLTIQIQVARICFIVGMGILFAIFICLAESYFVIFCTSFIGAYIFMLGLDLFAHTGMVNAFLVIFDGNQYHHNVYIMRTSVYVMLAFVIFLTIISFIWQYYWNIVCKKKGFGINLEERVEEKVVEA